jgi:hypothetical protein
MKERPIGATGKPGRPTRTECVPALWEAVEAVHLGPRAAAAARARRYNWGGPKPGARYSGQHTVAGLGGAPVRQPAVSRLLTSAASRSRRSKLATASRVGARTEQSAEEAIAGSEATVHRCPQGSVPEERYSRDEGLRRRSDGASFFCAGGSFRWGAQPPLNRSLIPSGDQVPILRFDRSPET